MKQCAKWLQDGAIVIHRPLRYPPNWPRERAQEKGIDTAIAVDFITMAIEDAYDLGVVVSTDADLLPALEFVRSRYSGSRAVAAWRHVRRIPSPPGAGIWCHWLHRSDYDTVADLTDYNR